MISVFVGSVVVGRRLSEKPPSSVATLLVTVQSGGTWISMPPQNANTSMRALSPSMRADLRSRFTPPKMALKSAPRKGRDIGRSSLPESIAKVRMYSACSSSCREYVVDEVGPGWAVEANGASVEVEVGANGSVLGASAGSNVTCTRGGLSDRYTSKPPTNNNTSGNKMPQKLKSRRPILPMNIHKPTTMKTQPSLRRRPLRGLERIEIPITTKISGHALRNTYRDSIHPKLSKRNSAPSAMMARPIAKRAEKMPSAPLPCCIRSRNF